MQWFLYTTCRPVYCSGGVEVERSPRMRVIGVRFIVATDLHVSRKNRQTQQVVTAPLPNARQKVWVSRVLGDDLYKQMPRVRVDRARQRTLTAQCPWRKPSIGQNLQPFAGYGDVSNEWKILEWGEKIQTKKQTNKQTFVMQDRGRGRWWLKRDKEYTNLML